MTVPCYPDNIARVAIIVNDEIFEEGTNFLLPDGCVDDPTTDITGKKSVYSLEIPCISTCDNSAAPSSAP